jgi:hypothetical protein
LFIKAHSSNIKIIKLALIVISIFSLVVCLNAAKRFMLYLFHFKYILIPSYDWPVHSPEKRDEGSEKYYQKSSERSIPVSSQSTTHYRPENYAQSSYSQSSTSYSTYQQPPVIYQSQPIINSYQYNTRRVPIGNIINLAASKVIGSSSNASQQSTSSSSRTALGFEDGFFSGHMERKDYDREMKHGKKLMRKCGRIIMSAQPQYVK